MFTSKSGAAALSIASNSILITLKIVAGIITGSVSILAEAIHSLLDLVAAIIAFFAVRVSDKPPDERHPFGHGKVENVSGVIEASLIFVAAGLIIYEAIRKIISGVEVELLGLGIGVMAVSIVVNILVSRKLLRVSRATDSIALEADARHLTTDVWTSAGVLVGLIAVSLTGATILDPIIAILVALLIIKAAYDILRKSFGGLIDTSLPKEEEADIIACISQHGQSLIGFHKLRTRKSGSWRFIDLHLVMPKGTVLEEAHQVCDCLEDEFKEKFPRTSITIHVEPCDMECDKCSMKCCPKRPGSSN